MKKFYLSIEQRDLIIDSLLRKAARLEREAKEIKPPLSRKELEISDCFIQNCSMLVHLLKVEEHER